MLYSRNLAKFESDIHPLLLSIWQNPSHRHFFHLLAIAKQKKQFTFITIDYAMFRKNNHYCQLPNWSKRSHSSILQAKKPMVPVVHRGLLRPSTGSCILLGDVSSNLFALQYMFCLNDLMLTFLSLLKVMTVIYANNDVTLHSVNISML